MVLLSAIFQLYFFNLLIIMKNHQLKPFVIATIITLITYAVNLIVIKSLSFGDKINYMFNPQAFDQITSLIITLQYNWFATGSILYVTLQLTLMALGGFLCAKKAKDKSKMICVRMAAFGVIVGYTCMTMLLNTFDFSYWILSNEFTSHRSSVNLAAYGFHSIAIQNAIHFILMIIVAGIIVLATKSSKHNQADLTKA